MPNGKYTEDIMLRIGTQSDNWYFDSDPDGSIAYIKSCGFSAVDFNLNAYIKVGELEKREPPYTSFYDKSVEELYEYFAPLKEACEKHDVVIAQIHAPFPTWLNGKTELNDYLVMVLEKCCAVSAFLNCPGIVVHPVHGAGDGEMDANLWLYRRLIPAAKKYGVKILLENIFARFNGRFIQGRMSSPDVACKYFDMLTEEAGFDAFGFCFDVGHAIVTCQNIPEFIRALGHRLTNLHIHDNNGLDDLHLLPYTCVTTKADLVCDWDGVVNALKDIGYRGALCFETFRALRVTPPAIWTEVLKLNSAIGRHWSDVILGEEKCEG